MYRNLVQLHKLFTELIKTTLIFLPLVRTKYEVTSTLWTNAEGGIQTHTFILVCDQPPSDTAISIKTIFFPGKSSQVFACIFLSICRKIFVTPSVKSFIEHCLNEQHSATQTKKKHSIHTTPRIGKWWRHKMIPPSPAIAICNTRVKHTTQELNTICLTQDAIVEHRTQE